MQVIVWSADGIGGADIAARLRISAEAVSRIRRRFLDHGVPGLAMRPKAGRKDHAVPAAMEERLVELATSPPPAGRSRWTTRLLARAVALSSEAQCQAHAAADARRCVAEGGTAADCEAAAGERFAACVAVHCTDDSSCEHRCARRGERAERRCLKHEGDAAACAEAGAEAQATCEARVCIPPRPEACRAARETAGAAAESLCLANGHPADECAMLGSGVQEACVGACGAGPPATCEEQCEQQAVQVHAETLDRGTSEGRASRRARRVLRRCYVPCTEG